MFFFFPQSSFLERYLSRRLEQGDDIIAMFSQDRINEGKGSDCAVLELTRIRGI